MEECELLRADSLENDLAVEGEFVTEETMEEWGWSPFLVFDFCFVVFDSKLGSK